MKAKENPTTFRVDARFFHCCIACATVSTLLLSLMTDGNARQEKEARIELETCLKKDIKCSIEGSCWFP